MPNPRSCDALCNEGGSIEFDVNTDVVHVLEPPIEFPALDESQVRDIVREETELNKEQFAKLAEELGATLKRDVLREVRETMLDEIMQKVPGLIAERLKDGSLSNSNLQVIGGSPARKDSGSHSRDSDVDNKYNDNGGSGERGNKMLDSSVGEDPATIRKTTGSSTREDSGNMRGTLMKNKSFLVADTETQSVGQLCQKTDSDGVPTLDARANEVGAQDWVYNWAETMWDAMPFFGLGVMTPSDSLLVVLIAMLNVAIQAAFIGLVGVNMTESLFHDNEIVNSLQDWRVSYAHNPDFADKFTSTPLGSAVCSESTFLMQGAQQAALYIEVREYIQNFLGMPSGACLSTLAVFLWILTCLKEFKRICLFTVGLWTPNSDNVGIFNNYIKRSYVQIQERTILWVYGEATQKNYQVFLTRGRVATLSVLVTLPRLCILVSLGFIGTQFLVATTELDELILNCVALEVVLNVDELLFLIFVPDSAARMVRKTKPLRVPKLRGVQARVMPWIRVVVVALLMAYIVLVSLSPLIDTMNEVERVMCGGKVDFLAVEMKFGAVVSGTPESFGIDKQSYRYRAIYQRTGLDVALAASSRLFLEGHPFQFTRVQTMDTWRERKFDDWATVYYEDKTFLPCVDEYWPWAVNEDLYPAFWAALTAKTTVQGISHCSAVKPLCFNDAGDVGKTARLLCPGTCGARDALSGLVMDQAQDGIPRECQASFVQSLALLPCTDYPLAVLMNTSNPIGQGWKDYGLGLLSIMSPTFVAMSFGNTTHLQLLRDKLWTGMSTYGCNYFSRQNNVTKGRVVYEAATGVPYPVDLCDVEEVRLFGRRTIRPFCPQTCECHTSVKQRYLTLGETWNERTGSESQCPGICWNMTR